MFPGARKKCINLSYLIVLKRFLRKKKRFSSVYIQLLTEFLAIIDLAYGKNNQVYFIKLNNKDISGMC